MPESDPQDILVRVVQDYVDAQLQGLNPDIEEVIRSHPELEQQIRQRIRSLQEVDDLFANLVQDAHDTAVPAFEPDLIGRRLGDFEILRLIGRGGMGAVFLARQVSLGREVALKVIADVAGRHSKSLERFRREATVLAQLSHPHIVPIHDTGQEGPYAWFAMEYVRGVSLDAILAAVRRAGPTRKASDVLRECLKQPPTNDPPGQEGQSCTAGAQIDRDYIVAISNIVVEVASALQCAHDRGILHRDVKPSNILIDPDGRAKLVDFGLARAQSHPSLTVTGEFFGTPNYVSPEQIRNPESAGGRSDVYSLAATYYECLTLRRPFEGDTVNETLTNVLAREVVPPRRHSPRLAPDLSTVLLHALEKQPQDRYQSATDFASDVRNVLEFRPIAAKRPATTIRICRAFRRNKLRTALCLLAVTAILLGAGLYRQWRKEATREQAAGCRRLLEEADLLLCQAAFDPHGWPVLAAEPLVDHAMKNYSEVLKIDSHNWWALVQRGIARLIIGTDKTEALRDFEQAERLSPDFAPLEDLKALALDHPDTKAQGITQPAIQHLCAREAFVYAILAFRDGLGIQKDKCIDLFGVCIEKEPAYLPGQVARACVRCQTEHNLEECRTLLRANPDRAVLHLLAARELDTWSSGKPEEAAAEYELAAQLQPWNPVCHVRLADVYTRIGDRQKAEACLKSACLLDSTAVSHLDLARFYSRQRDYPQALTACDDGLKKKCNLHCESELLEVKVSCLQRLGKTQELPTWLQRWEKCLRTLTATPSPSWGSYYHERLLEFLWNNGRKQEARILVTDSAQAPPRYQLCLGNYLCQLYESERDFANAALLCNQLYGQLPESGAFDTPSRFDEALDTITRRARYQLLLPGAGKSQAMATWEIILAKFPQNGNLWWYYGMFLDDSLHDPVKAAESYRQALRYQSNERQRVVTWFHLARALQRAGNMPGAEEELRALVHKIEGMRIMPHRDADNHATQTDIVEASTAGNIYTTLSDVYWTQHRTDLAIAVLERGLERVPSQPQIVRQLAKTRALIGSTSEAIATYTRYFDSLPTDLSLGGDNLFDYGQEAAFAGEAMFDLVSLLLKTADLDRAEGFLRREEQLNRAIPPADSMRQLPNYATYRHISWAKIHLAKGDGKSALAELDMAADTQRDAPLVSQLIVSFCLSNGQWEKAQQAAKRWTELDPSSQNASACLATALQKAGDHREAVKEFRRALTLQPGQFPKSVIYTSLGLSQLLLGQLHEAKDAYCTATQADANSLEAWVGLGVVCKRLHDYATSIDGYEHAAALAPDNPALTSSYSELADLYAACPESKLRNGPRAVQLATQACNWAGHKDHRPVAALAAAHAECGDFEKAVQYQDEAIGLLRGSQYSGIGIAVSKVDDIYRITGIGPNTPATSVDIRVGDIVTAVDGQSVQNMQLTDIVGKIKGPPGTTVSLTVKHENREIAEVVHAVRRPITDPILVEYQDRLAGYQAGKPWRLVPRNDPAVSSVAPL